MNATTTIKALDRLRCALRGRAADDATGLAVILLEQEIAALLEAAIACYLARGCDTLDAAMGLARLPREHDARRRLALEKSNRALCEARKHWPTAEALQKALHRFETTRWPRLRQHPEQVRGTPDALLLAILEGRGRTPSARLVRHVWQFDAR